MTTKLVFEFEDEQEFKAKVNEITKYHDLYSALWDMSQHIRSLWKHSEETHVEIEQLRTKFYDILGENNVEL